MTDALMGNYGVRTLTMVRGEGAYLYDELGNQYLDMMAGIAVCNLGHAHPAITATITAQAGQLLHCSNLFQIPQQQALATRLTKLSGLDAAFFCNSGTEANEAAIKLVRKYASAENPSKTKVLSLPHSFHGRTLGSLSITPNSAYQAGFAPLLPDVIAPQSLEEALALIDDETAGCFVEVIQGEGGVLPLPADFLQALESRLHAHGALLVVDEVQTGIGRTGTFFAFEQVGIQPDLITLAKGLGNGVPVGAVLAKGQVARAFQPGSHGSTFGGNPLAMAVANTVVEEVANDAFMDHVRHMGELLPAALSEFGTELSGRGLMWGFSVPNAKQFVADAAQAGVLFTTVGGNRVRAVPPLIITEKEIEELVIRLRHMG
jgi:acetylornithine/N-succinyldiaminopimelate aminotransferase